MAEIDKIRIHNFKAFYTGTEPEELILGGKHLLMYGENGSGKSSIYWALYTLFQSETKTPAEISKYFDPTHNEQLLNFHYLNARPDFSINADGKITNPTDIGKNAEIVVELANGTILSIDKDGYNETEANKLEHLHRHSDFITHRLLVNFYNFRNSKEINLWEVFVRDFFPFLIENKGRGTKTLWQTYREIEEGLPFNLEITTRTFKRSKSQVWQREFATKIDRFNEDIEHWLTRINSIANTVYKDELKNKDDIEIYLKYSNPLRYDHYADNEYTKDGIIYTQGTGFAKLNNPCISLNIRRKNTDGSFSTIHRPQAYLNEAKITQIALSIRFSLLHDTIKPPYAGQFLALDDLLISLDMSNRESVLDAILNIYAKKYKIYLFTHEMEFFNYCKFKIDQKKQKNDWLTKEIFLDNDDQKLEIIDSQDDYFEKSKKYFKRKDYVASAIYLRKDIEHFIKTRIPDEFSRNLENEYHNLDHFWNLFVERYKNLGVHLDATIQNWFKQTKLIVLNPSAHANLSQQIYKVELQKAFDFRKEIEGLCSINEEYLVIPEKTRFVFKHPTQNYVLEFHLKTDFLSIKRNANIHLSLPKAVIDTFSYNDVEWWSLRTSTKCDDEFLNKHIRNIAIDFNKMLSNLKKEASLAITDDMFYENTCLKGSILTLNEILEKFVSVPKNPTA